MAAFLKYCLLSFLLILSITKECSAAADCTKSDFDQIALPCDSKTGTRKIVSYKKNTCTLTSPNLAQNPVVAPCDCPPGKGMEKLVCKPCQEGSYGSGGELIDNWGSWTANGTVPPAESGIVTYCDLFRNYVKPCNAWKASYFNDTIESGDNSKTRCLSSVLTLRKKFVMPQSYVSFSFRVDGRKCYGNYLGCDGLAFLVDNKQVMSYTGIQFNWHTFRVNLTTGYHQLKWAYRKSCYSFPKRGLVDKAFIRSITLVGTDEPKSLCSKCPPGSYSKDRGSSSCIKCSYMEFQSDSGQTACKPCPEGTISMLGAERCYPLRNCTQDDLIKAPGPLSTCSKNSDDGNVYQVFIPKFTTVKVNDKNHVLCKPTGGMISKVEALCKCQPGEEILSVGSKSFTCKKCANGLYSSDGIKCSKCPLGQVALLGKHYYTWYDGQLPAGFSAQCSGDCAVKDGWIPSGDHIRTSRVIGDVDSFIQSPAFEISSNIAMVNFTCAITCNITQQISSLNGQHLADIDYCNLVFQVWSNDSIVDQVNCTKPKNKYVYRHEAFRDGRNVTHSYPLKNRTYTFRWVFHQADELKSTSASFEGKVYTISVIGVKGGSAMNCTKCPGGSYAVGGIDCSKCGIGEYSQPGWAKCKPCPKNTFSDQPGSPECLRCGANTESFPTRDGCTSNNCTFSPEEGVDYDLNELSRENGPMFEVLNFQTERRIAIGRQQRGPRMRLSIWPPYRPRFYVNLCTLKHENNSCTYRDTPSSVRKSLPVMACRKSWWGPKDQSLGKVIGFLPRKERRSGVRVEILHGDKCYSSKGIGKLNTTIDLICDVSAGRGSPGPENNYTQTYRPPCNYYFVWRSLYACPKCRKQDFERITSECMNGNANVTYVRTTACWGTVDGIPTNLTTTKCSKVAYYKTIPSAVNKVLIGVGVVVVVGLLCLAGFFFYKHRAIRYKYYGMITRNKPMSKLEEEEEDFGHEGGDHVFNDTHHFARS